MRTLRHRIAQRAHPVPILQSNNIVLTSHALLALVPTLREGVRLALSIRDPAALLRIFASYDGHGRVLLLLSSELKSDEVATLSAQAGVDYVISDRHDLKGALDPNSIIKEDSIGDGSRVKDPIETEWILTTSGTTGLPKMVHHTLAGLARTVRVVSSGSAIPVWGLTYEATRFAGLQVVLQSVLGGGTLVAPLPTAPIGERVVEFAENGVTHISATPTLWRRILMHPASSALQLCQITLGGEIVDQELLDKLKAHFPEAQHTHIYASTEVGVAFSVKDGREGFPVKWLDSSPGQIDLKIANDTLWIRVPEIPGEKVASLSIEKDADGFINTHDQVEMRSGRMIFLGRDTGVVNVGGAKVYPESVERVLNTSPEVVVSYVSARKNPFSGSILVAEIVLDHVPKNPGRFKAELFQYCRTRLPREAVPAVIKFVDQLDMNVAGKLSRS